ncbi:MAG: glycosyltransferase family 4 protein, partial [Acidimicrobiales bacterium]
LSPRAARAARRCVEAFAPDVVHLHEPFAPLIGWAILGRHAAPAVATFHRAGGGPAITLTRPLLRYLARGVDVAAAVSAPAVVTARAGSGLDAVELFNGFEVERFTDVAREPHDGVEVLFLGRLEARKGADTAISAVRAHNAGSGAPWRLVVAGDGPERARLVALAAGDPRVDFIGAVDDKAKRRWLRRADVVVAPSTHGESFGLVLLEAMASETPVVASDIEGYRDAARGHATLAPARDAPAWTRAIDAALATSSADLDAASAHARGWSMAALMDHYSDLYARARERFATTR